MKYKLCPQCGSREPYKNALDIYSIADDSVFWVCPQCGTIEQVSLTEFIARCSSNKKKKQTRTLANN